LIAALVGEAAVYVVSRRWEGFHREAAFVFAVLAAGAYAIERVGDDAIIAALETARDELKKIEGPRDFTESERTILISCLRDAPHKGVVHIRPGVTQGDAPQIADEITKVFEEAGGFEIKPYPAGGSLSWSTSGIFLIVADLKHAPSHATDIQNCFWKAGRKIFGYSDVKHAPDTVSIGIGSKL
jgi:hypothetical protein